MLNTSVPTSCNFKHGTIGSSAGAREHRTARPKPSISGASTACNRLQCRWVLPREIIAGETAVMLDTPTEELEFSSPSLTHRHYMRRRTDKSHSAAYKILATHFFGVVFNKAAHGHQTHLANCRRPLLRPRPSGRTR